MRTKLPSLAVGSLLLIWTSMAHGQLAEQNPARDVPTVTVAGRGQVQATPDRVTIRIGATAQAEQAGEAQNQSNAIVQTTLGKLKTLGLPAEKIQTVEITLQPVYAERFQPPGIPPKEPQIVGYRATNLIQVQSDDLNLVGKIIDNAVAAGANRLESISFELKDDTKARQQAIQLAVQEARGKAQAMANAMGVQLGAAVEAIEGSSYIAQPPVAYARAALSDVATPVQPGQLNISAFVTLRYRIASADKPGR